MFIIKAIIKNNIVKIVKCPHCGKKFEKVARNQVYCCQQCSYEAHIEGCRKYNERKKVKKSKRKCEICGKEFTPSRITQKCCCYKCQLERVKKLKREHKYRPIKKISDKRAVRLARYKDLRIDFLNQEKNKYCPVALEIYGRYLLATEVHHKAGRVGDLLLDTKKWLAVSRLGHNWIHEHPKEAYELGYLLKHNTKKIKK